MTRAPLIAACLFAALPAAAGPVIAPRATAAAPLMALAAPADDLAALFAQGLYTEYVATADAAADLSADQKARRAEANYRIGRFGRVIDDPAAAAALRAVAAAQLGACRRAAALLDAASPEGPVGPGDLALARGACALEAGDAGEAIMAAGVAREHLTDADGLALARYIEAAARNDRAALRTLAAGDTQAAARAALRLARGGESIERVRVRWSGGAFERDYLRRTAATRDVAQSITALRLLIARHPASDAAADAQERIGALLGRLFAEGGPPPARAASIFFDNVAFAPPGEAGDRLIRDAVETLARLGLYAEAADILDHQVQRRLRGGERSAVAARLAELALDAGKPEDALRALRSTRLHGLPAALVDRRFALEARALARIGEHDAALALLSEAEATTLIDLRADIAWRAQRWAIAAAAYALQADRRQSGAASVRAVAAAMLAGDAAQARAIAASAAGYASPREQALLAALTRDGESEFARDFIPAYREAFASAEG